MEESLIANARHGESGAGRGAGSDTVTEIHDTLFGPESCRAGFFGDECAMAPVVGSDQLNSRISFGAGGKDGGVRYKRIVLRGDK